MNLEQATPLFHSAQVSGRKPGRPIGATAKVMQDARALGVHHFAFVRSSILGLDLAESFGRYMAWAETTTDLRYVQNRRDALLKQIIEAGRALDATLTPTAKITQLLDLLRSDAKAKPAIELPSLADWVEAEGMDPDMWSEADLLDEYKAHFGLDNADAQEAGAGLKDVVGDRVIKDIASALPYDNPERVFQTLIAWGRYAGLMDINNKTRMVFVPEEDEEATTTETRH